MLFLKRNRKVFKRGIESESLSIDCLLYDIQRKNSKVMSSNKSTPLIMHTPTTELTFYLPVTRVGEHEKKRFTKSWCCWLALTNFEYAP